MIIKLIQLKMNKRPMDTELKIRMSPSLGLLTIANLFKLYDEMLLSNRIIDFDLSKYNTANVVFKPKNMTAEELYNGYINIYNEIYSLKNIFKRIPKSKQQVMPYLAFNLLYRKFGRLSEKVCKLLTFEKIGQVGEFLAYKLK